MFKILIKFAVALAIMSPVGLVVVSAPAEAGASQSAAPKKFGTPEHTARMLESRGVLQPNSLQSAWISARVKGMNASGQVVVSHVAVKSVRMPAMTMTFAVTDPGVTSRLKPGQQVEIEVVNISGAATVVNLR